MERGWEIGLVTGLAAGLGAGLAYLTYTLIHSSASPVPSSVPLTKSSITSVSSTGLSTGPLRVAPLGLPSSVTRWCGTVYLSLGVSPSNSSQVIIGKYINGALAEQYLQTVSGNSPFRTKGYWTGGVDCVQSTSVQPQLVLSDAFVAGGS